ncbi:MAG TPA: signal peptidase II [Candidatus Omnitrophica bacterium]|nr:signal peptidase II [Candidatus Omnitrophota bacterium]
MGLIFVGIIILITDQLIKNFILSRFEFNESIGWSFLNITLVRNTGTVFGLFKGNNLFFIIVGFITVLIITIALFKSRGRILSFKLCLVLVLSGAISNLIDRLRFGYVIDYIDLTIWPVFNLADSAITVAVVLFLFSSLIGKKT